MCDTLMVDPCHYKSVKIHRMCDIKGNPKINYGLQVIMCWCGIIDYNKSTLLGRLLIAGQEVLGNLTLSAPFFSELNTTLKRIKSIFLKRKKNQVCVKLSGRSDFPSLLSEHCKSRHWLNTEIDWLNTAG